MGICCSTSKNQGVTTSEASLLLNTNYKTATRFSLNGQVSLGVVVDCYDGDTCTIVMMYHRTATSFRCRLLGIDTPELADPSTKQQALLARNALISMVTTQVFTDMSTNREAVRKHLDTYKKLMRIDCGDWDKYGRLLVQIFPNDPSSDIKFSCNQMLLDGGYAKAYDGGTKSN